MIEEALHGWLGLEREAGLTPVRLPPAAFERMAEEFSRTVARHAAGVRLEMLTAASEVQLDVAIVRHVFAGSSVNESPAQFAATSGHELLSVATTVEGTIVTEADGETTVSPDAPLTITLALGTAKSPRRVQVWLPHNAEVEILAVRTDSLWVPAEPEGARWVHHGSSISHCLEAAGSLGTWPVIAARALRWDLTDVGLAGNSMLDPYVARALRDTVADILSLKVGINIVNGDAFTERTFVPALHGFLDTVREGHPHTPFLVITPVWCGIHEHTAGPTLFDAQTRSCSAAGTGTLTLSHVRSLVERVVRQRAASDPHLHLADGLTLLGEADAAHLWDNLHPDPAGYDLIGRRFVELVRSSELWPIRA